MKNGVVFEGKHEEHSTIGPGHYGNVNEGQFSKISIFELAREQSAKASHELATQSQR